MSSQPDSRVVVAPTARAATASARDGRGLRGTQFGRIAHLLIPLAVYAVSRLVGAAFLWIGAERQVALPATSPAYTVAFPSPASPGYFGVMSNWDGQWYRSIAENGYPVPLPTLADGQVAMNEWAFYPAFPLLSRVVMEITGLSFGTCAGLASVVCGAFAVCILYRMILSTAGAFVALATIACLCAFATAPVLQVGYTESLAMLLILLALSALQRQQYGRLVLFATVLSLTRGIVLPLAAVIAVHGLLRWRRQSPEQPFHLRARISVAAAAITTALLMGLWPLIAGVVTHRLDAFFVTQSAWPANQGANGLMANWFAYVLSSNSPLAALAVVTIVAGLALIVARKPAAAWGPELRCWALVYPLYLLAATRPTSSAARYFMLALVPLWPFPERPSDAENRAERRLRWLMLALLIVVGAVSQYFWVTRVFTIDESPESQPFP